MRGDLRKGASVVPGFHAVTAVSRYAGARVLISLDKSVVVYSNAVPAVARDDGAMDMQGAIVCCLDTMTNITFYNEGRLR